MSYTQWIHEQDGNRYRPCGQTISVLPPGYYQLVIDDNRRLNFEVLPARNDELLRFPGSVAKDVIDGITDFWDREEAFRAYGLPYKRGILLHGPAGMGKTSALQIIAREVIARGGIVLQYDPDLFGAGYRLLRVLQPDTPLVVLIEDVDMYDTLDFRKSAEFLNMLDGAENMDKVVFLATTNHPERLSARIVNRPSRFDITLEVPHPDIRMRRLYLTSLAEHEGIDVERYARDTEGMSFAHIKELFIATVILGRSYEEVIARLKAMSLAVYRSSDQPVPNGAGHYM